MKSVTLDRLKLVWFTFCRIILTIIFISSCPFILGIYLVLLAYRFVIFKTAKYYDPSLGKMVSAISNFFAAHQIYENSYAINIAVHVVGRLDKVHLTQAFDTLMKTAKTTDNSYLYPELTQRIVTRFGYTFWKNVEDFKVEDHIQYLDESNPEAECTLEELRELIAKYGRTPFSRKRSPWMVYLIKNFKSEREPSAKSAVVVRLHHCMFDGQSVFNAINKMVDNGPLILAGQEEAMAQVEAMMNSGGTLGRILRLILRPIVILFCGSYELVGQLMSYDNNELVKKSRTKFNGVMRFHESEPIPLEDLKKVKNHFGVGFTPLVTTLAVRSLKKFMESRGIHEDKIHMTFPLPVLDHPDKLRNYFSGGIISFDFRHDDRVQLLHETSKKFHDFRYSFIVGLPEASMMLLRILGSLPSYLVPKIDNVSLSTTMMNSSLPGPLDTAYYCGFPIVDATVGGSISKPYPIGVLSYSYRGSYRFGWASDTSILPTKEDAKELSDCVLEELQAFHQILERESV